MPQSISTVFMSSPREFFGDLVEDVTVKAQVIAPIYI